jgi:hypothetical protein
MSLNVEKVWLKTEDGEVLVPYPRLNRGTALLYTWVTSFHLMELY